MSFSLDHMDGSTSKDVLSRPLSDDGESVWNGSEDREGNQSRVRRDTDDLDGNDSLLRYDEENSVQPEAADEDGKYDSDNRGEWMQRDIQDRDGQTVDEPRSGAPVSDDSELSEKKDHGDLGQSSRHDDSADIAINRHEPIVHERLYRNQRHVRQTVILQDRHETVRQHILLPIHEMVEEEEPTTVLDLPQRGEVVGPGELSEENKDRHMAIHTELAQRTQITTPEVTHEYIDEEPTIEERVIRHVVKEIHPIIERDIHINHVIREVKQINRKLIDPDRITGLHIAETVNLDEWQERLKSGTDEEYFTRYQFEDEIW